MKTLKLLIAVLTLSTALLVIPFLHATAAGPGDPDPPKIDSNTPVAELGA